MRATDLNPEDFAGFTKEQLAKMGLERLTQAGPTVIRRIPVYGKSGPRRTNEAQLKIQREELLDSVKTASSSLTPPYSLATAEAEIKELKEQLALALARIEKLEKKQRR